MAATATVQPVILCGGTGRRLWPLSRASYPKQYWPVAGLTGVVHPGASLSLQMHHHRAEHWVVVRGTALVAINDTETLLNENESCFIPLGSRHRLHNPGRLPLELIEVQSGAYLGEDDIVRFEDHYGRSGDGSTATPRLNASSLSAERRRQAVVAWPAGSRG